MQDTLKLARTAHTPTCLSARPPRCRSLFPASLRHKLCLFSQISHGFAVAIFNGQFAVPLTTASVTGCIFCSSLCALSLTNLPSTNLSVTTILDTESQQTSRWSHAHHSFHTRVHRIVTTSRTRTTRPRVRRHKHKRLLHTMLRQHHSRLNFMHLLEIRSTDHATHSWHTRIRHKEEKSMGTKMAMNIIGP